MPGTPRSQIIAFSRMNKESAFGIPIADGNLINWIPCEGPDYPDLGIGYRDDSKVINGFLGPTLRQIETREGKKAWKFEASAESLGFFTIMQFGKVTMTGSGDPYSAVVKARDVCTINPPSFTYVHGLNCAGATGTYYRRKGAVINTHSVEIKGKGPLMQTIALEDDGSVTADSGFSFPASPDTVQTLLGSMCQLQFGAVGSLVDLSAAKRLRTWKATFNSQIKRIDTPNSAVTVDEFQYGEEAPLVQVEFTIKGDESSPEYALYNVPAGSPTLCQMIMTVDAGTVPDRYWQMTQTNCHILSCTPKPAGNENQLDIKLGVLNTSTDAGPCQFLSKCGQSAYLVGNP